MAIYQMFLDAIEANVPIRFEPKPIFKPNAKKPMIDTLDANRNKVGAPFQYAESLFMALEVVKSMTGLPYRHLQGMLIETLSDEDSPCYTTIHRRFQALDVKRHDGVFTVTGGGTAPVRLAVDSTCLK